MSQIDTTRSGNVIVPYVEAKKRTKYVDKTVLAVTGNNNFALLDSSGYAYADSNGNWRLAFNLWGGQSSASGATLTFPVTFHPSMEQAILVTGDGPTTGACIAANGSSSSVSYSFPTNVTAIRMSGDVALESKPTWADANMEDTTEVDIFISENSLPGSKLLDASTPMSKLSAYEEGSFTATGVGFSGSVTGTAHYVKIGKVVTLELPLLSGTSNATLFEITGLPSDIFPARYLEFAIPYYTDSSALGSGGAVMISMVGAISLYKAGYATWTASGTKAVPGGGSPWVLTYLST